MAKLVRVTTVGVSMNILLKGQLSFMKQFFEVVAVSSPGKELKEAGKREMVRTREIYMTRKITPFRDIVSLVQMIFLLWKEKPDIVHSHTPKAGMISMIAGLAARVPVRLHTVAGLPLMETSGLKKKILVWVERLTYACATKVYPNSFQLKNYIQENIYKNRAKLKVIGNGSSNGIDGEYFNLTDDILQQAKKLRAELNIADQNLIFCFAGRIVKDKGIEELIKAFLELSTLNPDNLLLLVGNFEDDLNPLDPFIKESIHNSPKVIVAGFQKDIRPYLAVSDIFVFPSYREGFPNVVMQAACMELPVIVTNINGSNEIIENEVNGLIVQKKDYIELLKAMKRLADDRNLRDKLTLNSRNSVLSRFSQNIVWAAMLKEYHSLLNKM